MENTYFIQMEEIHAKQTKCYNKNMKATVAINLEAGFFIHTHTALTDILHLPHL